MSLNWREIDAVLSEIDLEGARLIRVRQPDYRRVILEFGGRKGYPSIVIVLTPPFVRIHTWNPDLSLPRALPRPPRFAAVMKARLEGAHLTSLAQLGEDRIVRFVFHRNDEEIRLDAKLWGNGANLILSGADGLVIDAYSRRPARGESPGEIWPPTGFGRTGPAVRPGVRNYVVRDLPGGDGWNRKIDEYYSRLEHEHAVRRRRDLWQSHIARRLAALEVREHTIETATAEFRRQVSDGHWGDVIMAHLHEIPPGSTVLEAADWEADEATVLIPLDPRIPARDNAELYYRRRRRAVRGIERLTEDRQALDRSRRELEDLDERIRSDDFTRPPLDTDPPGGRESGGNRDEELPGLRFPRGYHTIVVGRSADESDTLLRHWARGNDLWLHVRDWPGGHVFVRSTGNRSVPLDVLLDAGNLALVYSKGRAAGEADIYYTRVKYLRRPRGGDAGTVLPTMEKNLRIRLDPERLSALRGIGETVRH